MLDRRAVRFHAFPPAYIDISLSEQAVRRLATSATPATEYAAAAAGTLHPHA